MVLCKLLLEQGIDFSVAHCNFQLRGTESDGDQEFVQQTANSLGLEAHIKSFDTLEYARNKKLALQLAARELRYAWFEELLDSTGSDFLLTAHHADDNLETFLINLSRGSGLKGLSGIPKKINRIRRPLLPFSRESLQLYAESKGLSWREDTSNQQNKYLRNKIRNELMPKLKEVLPTLPDGFASTVHHLGEAQTILKDRLEEIEKEVIKRSGEVSRLDIKAIQSLSHPGAYLYELLSPHGFTQWQDIEDLLTAQSGKMVFSATHRLLKDRDLLLLQSIESLPDAQMEYPVAEGQTSLELDNSKLLFNLVAQDEMRLLSRDTKPEPNAVYLDLEKLNFPLLVRKWQKGDYIYPKGMRGKKKLSKFFTDEKLSIPQKENIWLLCSENEIAWIVGHRSDERFKVTDKTKSALHVEWIQK